MSTIPLISNSRPDGVFGYRAGQPVSIRQFLSEVAQLAQTLPDKRYILNLCADRYRFAVGFAAALLRGQTSLLPPTYTPGQVERLGQRYPDMYCLADGEAGFRGIEVMRYPQLAEAGQAACEIPSVAATQRAALVFTSGSTGEPVAHAKSWGSLCHGAAAEAASLAIVPDSGLALLGTVPAQHMYGLESCMLLAMQNGLALVAERPFYPADICAQLSALPQPRCLVTTPVHLRTLLAEAAELPTVEFVLCATAHLAPQLAVEAEARFAAPLHEIYGCTEAGQVASRRTTEGAAWHLLPSVEMRQDEHGCTTVRGGHVEIEATLSDVVERNADGTFTLHGRTADLVNIAGKRTSLASLNHHLNAIAGVRDGVFLMPGEGDEMQRPMAFVVAPGLKAEQINSALRDSVDPVFLPRPLYFVEALPRNATGKLTRESLLQLKQQCSKK